jgi:hypothetical protein
MHIPLPDHSFQVGFCCDLGRQADGSLQAQSMALAFGQILGLNLFWKSSIAPAVVLALAASSHLTGASLGNVQGSLPVFHGFFPDSCRENI